MTNYGRDGKALDGLLPGFGELGLGPKCQPEEEMLRSRCLIVSDLMPRMPTELAGQ
jgi:hypothetical protein